MNDIKVVHVNDALRHHEVVDAAYVRYLDEKYGIFTAVRDLIEKSGRKPPPIEDSLSAMKNYDFLSEISHPNGLGVQFIYPQLSGIDEGIKEAANGLLDRYRFKALMAVYQCHHLVDALETTTTLPERYRKAFM